MDVVKLRHRDDERPHRGGSVAGKEQSFEHLPSAFDRDAYSCEWTRIATEPSPAYERCMSTRRRSAYASFGDADRDEAIGVSAGGYLRREQGTLMREAGGERRKSTGALGVRSMNAGSAEIVISHWDR